ncbi:MAG: efflux RND transporter periplasmic adaptor subunit, partial [Pirellulales bacterium]
ADTSIEQSGLRQAINFVESMNRTVEAAREQVKSSEAKLGYAAKNLERFRQLFQRAAASEEELNRAEVDEVEANVEHQQDRLILRAMESIQVATAILPVMVRQYIQRKGLQRDVLAQERAQAAARLDQTLRDQKRGTMTSPVEGVVLRRHVTNERLVPAGTVLLEIGQLDQLEVDADILSQEVVRVAVGNPVDIYGPSIGPEPARGTVSRIYPAGFTKISSLGVEQQRVKVVVDFDPDELARLRSAQRLGVGYRVRVRIYTDQRAGALVIPRTALFRGAGGNWQVFAVRGRRARIQPIQVGLLNDDLVEVRDGLEEGDLVVLAPEASLTDGTRVRPIVHEGRRLAQPPLGE